LNFLKEKVIVFGSFFLFFYKIVFSIYPLVGLIKKYFIDFSKKMYEAYTCIGTVIKIKVKDNEENFIVFDR
jgi:hypothetical protein